MTDNSSFNPFLGTSMYSLVLFVLVFIRIDELHCIYRSYINDRLFHEATGEIQFYGCRNERKL